MDNGISPADIAALTKGDGNGFGGNGDWLAMIFLFALIFGFGGNGWGTRGNGVTADVVTQGALDSAMNFNQLENSVGRLRDMETQSYMGLQNGISNLGYDQLRNELQTQAMIQNASASQAQCCCGVQRAIDGVNYNGAINTAQINANMAEQTQKILDAICGNRIADMQNRINQLELQNAVAGVVKYPTAFTYSSGANPFCGCGCGNI